VSPADSFGTAIGVGIGIGINIGIGVGIELTNPISSSSSLTASPRCPSFVSMTSQSRYGPADRLEGRTVYVELLMTEWHRAFSLSIPIPIPIATPTPIALCRCLDSVV
jgi:hypothetical protein